MKIFIWESTLETKAYHGDGSAAVIAETLGDAIDLLKEKDGYYLFSQPASVTEPSRVVEAGNLERQILLTYVGCDC